MKAKMFYIAGIILLSLLFFKSIKAINSGRETTENYDPGKRFLVTALHCGSDPNNMNGCNPDFTSSFYSHIKDTLRFNSWHRYNCWFIGDQVFGDSSVISQGIASTLSQNNQRDLTTVFDRPITRYLAYGQRSDYQCEQVADGADYYFHAFETSITNTYISDMTDNSSFGGGAKVKFCSFNAGSPGVWEGYVVKDLRSNREQCNRIIDHTRDDTYDWYVKPRIRIDTAFANDPANQNVKVCRIDIFDWNGDTVKKVDISVRNFKSSELRYGGNYLEEYYLSNPLVASAIELSPTELCPTTVPMKNAFNWDEDIRTDFRVYWYGECEMFLDYIRLENEPANRLFNVNNNLYTRARNQLISEINLASSTVNASNPYPNNFYNEEFEFNMTPSTQELSRIIDSVSQGKISLMVNLNMELYNAHIPRYWEKHVFIASEFKKYLIDNSKIKIILPTAYNLEGWLDNDSFMGTGRESYNPNTLPVYSAYPDRNRYDTLHGLLTYPASPAYYDNWLQYNFDDHPYIYYKFTNINKIMDSITKLPNANLDIMYLHQSHMWHQYIHKLKEPTNEELEMTANLHLTYGTKGFMYFAYNGICEGNGYNTIYQSSVNPPAFSTGFVDKNKNIRDTNAYGQNKWNFYKRYNRLLEKWGPHLVNFSNSERNSYIYRKPEERSKMISNGHFVNEIFTYKPQSNGIESNTPDPINERYIQAAFFDRYTHLDPPPNPPERYFMIVNRRGSPYIDNSSSDKIGGKRFIKMSIHPFSLWFIKFRNVSLQDLSDNSIVTTFNNVDNINYNTTIDLGWFNPGEAKLFKLAPAMCVGGSLVADEWDIMNEEFTCEGQVNTNGKTVMIGDSTVINFTPQGKITVNGGSFASYASYPTVKFRGLNGQPWNGIALNNSVDNAFYNTVFENTNGYTINGINSNVYLQNCEFNINSGALNLNNLGSTQNGSAYIQNCKFTINNNSTITCNLRGNAGNMINVQIDGNEFIGTNGSLALNTHSAYGTVKNNKISQYYLGMFSSGSSLDFYNNTLNSIVDNSKGINAVAMSSINLGINGQGVYTGGRNTFKNTGSNSNNIYVDNSFFNIHGGYNDFSITNILPSTSYHLKGTFPQSQTRDYPDIYAGYNCFKLAENVDIAKHSVFWTNSGNTQVNFLFNPYRCLRPEVVDAEVITHENGYMDSLFTIDLEDPENLSQPELLYNGLSLDIRQLDFEEAVNKSKSLISEFADSLEYNRMTLDAVSKLYSSIQETDITGNEIENLKTYFENIILNHPENTELISKAFYFIQKCKSSLEDYSSALTGFQQIIDQNPYSYEALVASWDYDAVTLLDSLSGSGGGENNSELTEEDLKKKYLGDDPNDRYDTKKFSKDDRKLMRENIYKSQMTLREIKTDSYKKLEKKISEGEATKNEKTEYENLKVLNELSKPKNPGTIDEHINNVNNDLNKVLGISAEGSANDKIISINPYEYNLSQNYPNPFNPVTKISFDIPKDGMVKLTVYDLLGREVVRLVNNEFKLSGRHTVDFNGSNLSSGIYFYKLETEGFIATKKMVLLK